MPSSSHVSQIVQKVLGAEPTGGRVFIAIAGPPASGKSTLAAEVKEALSEDGLACGLVPMDGFHLSNEELKRRGKLARKGAPDTFDLAGFTGLLTELSLGHSVAIPAFDRHQDAVVPAASVISSDVGHIVVEGNYLCLNSPGWRELQSFWTHRFFIAPPIETLKARLIDRWITHGLTKSAAEKRATENDLVNAELVLAQTLVGPEETLSVV